MKLLKSFILAIVIYLLFSSCSVYLQKNSAKYTTHWESYGEYDIKNKTFYIIPLDSNISKNNLEFKEFANEFEKSLIYSGAVKSDNEETADMCILMNYGISDESYTEKTSVPIYGQTGISSITTTSNTIGNAYGNIYSYGNYAYGNVSANSTTTKRTVVVPKYGITGYETISNNVSKFLRYVSLYAFDNQEKDDVKMIWQINIASEGSSNQLRKIIPYMAYSTRCEYGKKNKDISSFSVYESDYMYSLYESGFLLKDNFIVWPKAIVSNEDFQVAFVEKGENETSVCIRKTKGTNGYYLFGDKIYLEVNGSRYEGKVANDNYILGQKIWKEYGTRYFSFVFPIKLEPNSSINIFEEDSQGKKGKSWMNISVK